MAFFRQLFLKKPVLPLENSVRMLYSIHSVPPQEKTAVEPMEATRVKEKMKMSEAPKLTDSITIASQETAPCERKIEFSISAPGVECACRKAAKAVLKQAHIPGFRVGKAPLSLVMNRYRDYIMEDTEKALQSAAFEKLSSGEFDSLDIVSFGGLSAETKPESGKEYSFSVNVEVSPEIKLPEYKNLPVEVEEGADVEKRIAERIEYLKNLYSDFTTVQTAAQKGDMLKVSYESDFTPEENAPASLTRAVKADQAWIWLNEPEQFPGIIAALDGKEPGVEIPVQIAYPADWREVALQGKSVNYKFKIQEIQRKTPIESEEKLAEKLHADSVEKMMEDLRNGMEKEMEYEQKEKVKAKLLELLLPVMEKAELPKGLFASTVQREFQRIAERLVRSEKDVETFKTNREKHMEEARKAADEYLRKFFLLRKIAHVENISVSEGELDAQVKGMSAYMGYKESDLRKMIEKNGGESEIQADILMNKVLDLLATSAAVSKKH